MNFLIILQIILILLVQAVDKETYHFLYMYNELLPEEYDYFNSKKIGRLRPANFCPEAIPDNTNTSKENNLFFSGHCAFDKGDYGQRIPYNSSNSSNPSNSSNYIYYSSNDLKSILYENNPISSFCVLSSLIK